MKKDDLKYWVGFSMIPGIGAARGNRLVSFFDSMENAWKASDSDLSRAGIEETIITEIKKARGEINLDIEMEKIEKEGIRLITIKDKNYPKLLKEIYNPPFLLYVRGELKSEDEFAFAVVGARRCSDYGRQVTKELVTGLAQNKITIISGLAAGIDGIAHQAALAIKDARTIAVLGCGIDDASIYPTENRALAAEIINGRGAIISEYPIFTPPLKQNFPARNRIISGLSLGVLVVEATEVSGSLITGQFALEQGRDVFAVPGSIYNKNASGPNALIKKGAKLVERVDDILEELHLKNVAENIEAHEIIPENENEEKVLKVLELESKHIDEIAREAGIAISDLNGTLVTMEMKGLVRNVGGGNYMRAKR
ncbi:MAG TPA: DNA-processing protein DprA [Patescibacteria group bacterium]|nr:DNA-processing protein DprA [Patescibacteria group bacterium]